MVVVGLRPPLSALRPTVLPGACTLIASQLSGKALCRMYLVGLCKVMSKNNYFGLAAAASQTIAGML